jgi:hypothetical protein
VVVPAALAIRGSRRPLRLAHRVIPPAAAAASRSLAARRARCPLCSPHDALRRVSCAAARAARKTVAGCCVPRKSVAARRDRSLPFPAELHLPLTSCVPPTRLSFDFVSPFRRISPFIASLSPSQAGARRTEFPPRSLPALALALRCRLAPFQGAFARGRRAAYASGGSARADSAPALAPTGSTDPAPVADKDPRYVRRWARTTRRASPRWQSRSRPCLAGVTTWPLAHLQYEFSRLLCLQIVDSWRQWDFARGASLGHNTHGLSCISLHVPL